MPKFAVIVPMRNALPELQRCLDSVIKAANRHGNCDILVVDNGSTDGSRDYVAETFGQAVQLESLENATIGQVRNFGSSRTDSDYLAFVDSDCVLGRDHFVIAESLLEEGIDLAAVGCRVGLPERPGWIEATWHAMHFPTEDRAAAYINSGNLVVRRTAFNQVGGFSEELETGEDAELGQKLRGEGWSLREFLALEVAHLRNPKSLRAFWAKETWHGLGMFGTVTRRELDKPTVMTAAHAVLVSLGIAVALSGLASGRWRLLPVGVAAIFLVPLAAVSYRRIRVSRKIPWMKGTFLYELYFLARFRAITKILAASLRSRRGPSGQAHPWSREPSQDDHL